MRKLLYFTMFILGVAVIVSMLIFPFYKFNDEKILKNYSEYEYYLNTGVVELGIIENDGKYYIDIENTGNTGNSKVKELEGFNKDLYNKEVFAVLASMNNDIDLYYENRKYEVVNEIYFTQMGIHATPELDYTSSDEVINVQITNLWAIRYNKLIEANKGESEQDFECLNRLNTEEHIYFDGVLTSNDELTDSFRLLIGEKLYNVDKDALVESKIQDMNAKIHFIIGDNASEKIGLIGSYDVLSGLLLLVNNSNPVFATDDVNKYREKGLATFDLVDSWINLVFKYQEDFAKPEFTDVNFFGKVKYIAFNPSGYNPWPLVIVSGVVIYILLTGFMYVFGALKGVIGKKKPKLLIKSLIFAALMFILYSRANIIPADMLISYHSVEVSRLLNLMLFGNFQLPILIAMAAGLLGAVITILGTFCKWSKKKNKKKKEAK